ncbi:hypothetical protein ACFVT5_10445 [Streptomyces sp. NPDC058001]|uniref:hypothetical protein n=1 Tax=Streptomyces sp. NPDC058001 TaxID=3346300 RepID=UPI0036F0586E
MTHTIRTFSTAAALAVGALLSSGAAPALAEGLASAGPLSSDGLATAAKGGLEVVRTCGLPTVSEPASVVQNCTEGSLSR